LLSTFYSGENAARIGDPDERFWIGVGFDDETVDSEQRRRGRASSAEP
jgi:hypothetical protein